MSQQPSSLRRSARQKRSRDFYTPPLATAPPTTSKAKPRRFTPKSKSKQVLSRTKKRQRKASSSSSNTSSSSSTTDDVRDTVVANLRLAGVEEAAEGGVVAARSVFGHCGIYVGDKILGWVSHQGFGVRPGNQRVAAQRAIMEEAGCTIADASGFHKKNPYWSVPESLWRHDSAALGRLALAILATLPHKKAAKAKQKTSKSKSKR